MSDGHARTTGALYRVVTLGGNKYKLRPFSLGVLPEMEAFIISKREDPIVWATRACLLAPESQHKVIWEVAMEKSIRARAVTDSEINEFRGTSIGNAWVFWVCARQDNPGVFPDKATCPGIYEDECVRKALEIMSCATDQELAILQAEAQVASGEADAKNSTGRPAASPLLDLADGQLSTSSSPISTDGT
jgi:hypothetical protein